MWLQQENEELLATLEATATEQGIAVPLVLFPAGRPRTLGKLTKSERDTLELVERSGPVTAAELRSQVNLRTPSASNRLRRLYRLRLVRREERIVAERGGREFIYQALAPGATARAATPSRPKESTHSRLAR